MSRRIWFSGLVVLHVAVGASCGGSTPGQPSPPPPPPPANNAPVLESITVSRNRLEAGNEATLTAVVRDNETAVDQLRFDWTATAGTFSGQGATVRWQAPIDGATPADYSITLTVTETYGTAGAGGSRPQHVVTGTAPAIRVHNSPREIGDLALVFLRDFANSSVSPTACVRDFADSCPGKAAELSDIESNREHYVILSSVLETPAVSVSGNGMTGTAVVECEFFSRITKCSSAMGSSCAVGMTERVRGDCSLTAVYEQSRWWLCESRFLDWELLPSAFRRFFGARG